MKWLKSYKLFELNVSNEKVEEILDIIQYFLEDEDIYKSKEAFAQLVSKDLVNEWIYTIRQNKVIIAILMNNELYPKNEIKQKIYNLVIKLKLQFIPMIEEKTKIEILEQKIDSWNFTPTGIRIEIQL